MIDDRNASASATEPTGAATIPRERVGVMDADARRASLDRAGWGSGSDSAASPEAVPSAAALAGGHPLHPMLVPLPIGLLSGALGTDLAYLATKEAFWARASLALTAGGLVTGALAGSAGLTDFLTRPRIREHRIAWLHGGGNVAVLGLGLAGFVARFRDPRRAVVPTGLAISIASGALLLLTGWLGGELVYRHGVGLIPER